MSYLAKNTIQGYDKRVFTVLEDTPVTLSPKTDAKILLSYNNILSYF